MNRFFWMIVVLLSLASGLVGWVSAADDPPTINDANCHPHLHDCNLTGHGTAVMVLPDGKIAFYQTSSCTVSSGQYRECVY
ncbi:MAG TPA: hypothetical protein PKC45_01285, partial [Gemmatales bacterium]|nr:hypothetical protein [Gemmatales bacterium]